MHRWGAERNMRNMRVTIGSFYARSKLTDLVKIVKKNKAGSVICVDINGSWIFANKQEVLQWTALPWIDNFDDNSKGSLG